MDLSLDLRRNLGHIARFANGLRSVDSVDDLVRFVGHVGAQLAADWTPSLRLGRSERAYAGAVQDDHTAGWFTPSTSANAEILSAGPWLRNRSRNLTQNNPHATRAIWDLVLATVGNGIQPQPNTKDRELNRKIKRLWERWSRACYVSGELDFVGVEYLAVRAALESGNVLVRGRPRYVTDGLPVPLQVQVLEADFLDNSKSGQSFKNGNYILAGIEFDSFDRRVKYHLFKRHPGDPIFGITGGELTSTPVDAANVAHLFFELRPGQVLGVPWLAAVVRSLRDYDDMNDAELNRRILEACHVATVSGGDPDSAEDGVDGIAPADIQPKNPKDRGKVLNSAGRPIEKFKPGQIGYAPPGKKIDWHAPASVSGVQEFASTVLHRIAAGIGVPYSRLTTDYSQENFSSARIGNVPFRALTQTLREQFIIPLFLERVWRWWGDQAVLAGLIPREVLDEDGRIPVRWTKPRFEEADRLSQTKADIMDVRAGFKSRDDIVADRGDDPDEVREAIVAVNQADDEANNGAGIVTDSDPRRTTAQGLYQSPSASDLEPQTDKPGKPSKKS